MASVTSREIIEKNQWEDFIKSSSEANFLQSWYWGAFHKDLGHEVVRLGFYKNDDLVGIMLGIVENAKRGRYLTIPGGPIINRHDSDVVQSFVDAVRTVARQLQCVFVRVRPQLLTDDFARDLFSSYGFVDAPMHLHAELTSQLDLSKSEDELMQNLRKTTRYEIRKAQSERIEITTSTDIKAIEGFYTMQIETSQRHGFVPFSRRYLMTQFEVFATEGCVLMYSAFFEKKLLAQAFVIYYGQEAVYHYGASTPLGRSHPGAYLIQWNAILEAKRRGMTRYNFWGVAPPDAKDHRFYGVSVFKRGFGGNDVSYLHAQDLVLNPMRYVLSSTIERVRRRIRKV